MIGEAELARSLAPGYPNVTGSDGGQYRIGYGITGNVAKLDEHGCTLALYCAHPSSVLTTEAAHLAQVLALVTDEPRFLAIACLHMPGYCREAGEPPGCPCGCGSRAWYPQLLERSNAGNDARLGFVYPATDVAEGGVVTNVAGTRTFRFRVEGFTDAIRATAASFDAAARAAASAVVASPTISPDDDDDDEPD